MKIFYLILTLLTIACAGNNEELSSSDKNALVEQSENDKSALSHSSVISGNFEFNKIMNEPFETDSIERIGYSKTMDSLNIDLIETYIKAMRNAETEEDYQKAEKLLSTDAHLSSIPSRAIAIFYTMYWAHKNGLLFNPCLVLMEEYQEEGKVIYLTLDQFERVKPILHKKLDLKVEHIATAKATNIKIYKLVEIK